MQSDHHRGSRGRWVLGDEPRQRSRALEALLVLAAYLVFAAIQHVEVLLGLIDAPRSWALTAWNLTGGIGFYAAIRSGLNLRLRKDRALALPQTLWAMVGVSWSYAITGPARGAILLIMMTIMMYGVFGWTPARARVLTAAGFSMLAVVMVWRAVTDPALYDPRVEGLHLAFSAVVLVAVAALSVRVSRMRARLETQRTELAAALERIQSLATRDELTGLLNRRAILERLNLELRARGTAAPLLAVALIDLDHFKRVNDRHGHAAGDRVLRRFADIARTEVRGGDVLARWGGEEFLLMMPGASTAQGLACLERVRDLLQAQPLDDVAPGLVIRFSAGVAECRGAVDLEAAIERADAAMYRAKEAGRDRALTAA